MKKLCFSCRRNQDVTSSFTFENVEDKHTEELISKTVSRNQSNADHFVWPPGCCVNSRFRHFLQKIQDFEVLPDDTWVITFPKCGKRIIRSHVRISELMNNFFPIFSQAPLGPRKWYGYWSIN